jgi:hypothetical protein
MECEELEKLELWTNFQPKVHEAATRRYTSASSFG